MALRGTIAHLERAWQQRNTLLPALGAIAAHDSFSSFDKIMFLLNEQRVETVRVEKVIRPKRFQDAAVAGRWAFVV